jgi:hypothetical protein
MKGFVVAKRFLPEIAALVCFALVTAANASATATHVILYVALAVILAIEFGPDRVRLWRQKRRGGAKALPGGARSKGSR